MIENFDFKDKYDISDLVKIMKCLINYIMQFVFCPEDNKKEAEEA